MALNQILVLTSLLTYLLSRLRRMHCVDAAYLLHVAWSMCLSVCWAHEMPFGGWRVDSSNRAYLDGSRDPPRQVLFCALAFNIRRECRNANCCLNIDDDSSTCDKNFVNFGPVTSEICRWLDRGCTGAHRQKMRTALVLNVIRGVAHSRFVRK